MKRLFLLFMSVIMTVALCACSGTLSTNTPVDGTPDDTKPGNNVTKNEKTESYITGSEKTEVEDTESNDTESPETESDDTDDKGFAVIYFSCTNTTEGIALKIAKSLGVEAIEIQPKVPYTSADLNYNNNSSRANKEQNDDSARPEIANKLDFDGVDTVFIGFPIWWGKEPRIIDTLCDLYDFSGKKVVLFCTSGSSGISSAESNFKKMEPKANVLDSRRLVATDSQNEIDSWVDGLCARQ